MFKRLQLKMTLYYSLILITVLAATNLSIYYVMVNYNNYQMSTEISRMLDSITGSEWLYDSSEENKKSSESDAENDDATKHSLLPAVKDLIIPQTLKTFSVYMIYDQTGQLITWKSDNTLIFDKLLKKSAELSVSEAPSIATLSEEPSLYYLMAKMPLIIEGQSLGYYTVARDVTTAYQTLNNLSKILVISLFAGVFIAALLGYLIAGRSLKPVKAAYASKQEFLANAAHELKTPLSVILLSTETLEGEISPEYSFQKQVVSDIEDEAQKMNHLVSQLLFLSRTDSQSISDTYEYFNISEMIEKEITAYNKIARTKGVVLTHLITPGLKVKGDRKQLISVISILLDNAIKYSKENGSVDVTLEKSHDAKNQGIKLTVKDTGIGMPEAELKHIFERFYRLESSRSKETGGYGLGLAIAKEIVDQHKGSIQVDSLEKVGTTFIVYI